MSLIFYSMTYFGSSTTFVYFSKHPLWIYYADRYADRIYYAVYFTVSSGRRDALFFLKGQMFTIGSTFIKKI